jgi:hypothetical protein
VAEAVMAPGCTVLSRRSTASSPRETFESVRKEMRADSAEYFFERDDYVAKSKANWWLSRSDSKSLNEPGIRILHPPGRATVTCFRR